jgi:Ran GTPase-activating protein (RanGAP) involved in mRNA processing and transport
MLNQNTIETSVDEWQGLVANVHADSRLCHSVAEQFAQQLQKDHYACDNGQMITDCAVWAPHLYTVIDKQTLLAHQIATLLYPDDEQNHLVSSSVVETVHNKTIRYILYRRLIVKLRRAYRQQTEIKPTLPVLTPYQQARLTGDRAMFYQLQQIEEIPEDIVNPVPMPVEVAPLPELSPFFDFLRSNQPIVDRENASLSFTRGTFFSDGRMDLCKQVVGAPWIGELMNSLVNNQHIKHFLLGNNVVDRAGAKAIADFIRHPHQSQIETWYLAGNRIDAQGIALISKAMQTDQHCKALWLKRNPLKPQGAKHLGSLLEQNPCLEILDLHNTGLLDEGVAYLFEGLKQNRSLDLLYLEANGISSRGAKPIADYFSHLVKLNQPGISSLFCGINRLGDDGVAMIAESLRGYQPLKRLALGSNRLGYQGLKVLLEQLNKHPNLIYLDLGLYKSTSDLHELPNNLGDESVPLLAEFIQTNQSVQILSVKDANLSLAGLEQLAEAIQANHRLLMFHYEQLGVKKPKTLIERINDKLAENIQNTYGVDMPTFRQQYLRYLKHTDAVRHIDSIYRNKDCCSCQLNHE